MSESSGWISLLNGSNYGAGALWSTGDGPWQVEIPESEKSATLIVTGLQFPIVIPVGATEISATYRFSGGFESGNNRELFDTEVRPVIGGVLGVNIKSGGSPGNSFVNWEVAVTGVELSTGSFDGVFGVGIKTGAYANGPTITTDVWLSEVQVRATWTPPPALVAREQILYT